MVIVKVVAVLMLFVFCSCSDRQQQGAKDNTKVKISKDTTMQLFDIFSRMQNQVAVNQLDTFAIADEPFEIMSGDWDGSYYDMYGFKGMIKAKFKNDNGNIVGSIHIGIIDEEQTIKIEGLFYGQLHGDELHFRIYPPNDTSSLSKGLDLVGYLKNNKGSYANQTLFGVINPPKLPNGQMLGGGVWIMWHSSTR